MVKPQPPDEQIKFTPMEKEALMAQIADYTLFNMTHYEMYVALQKRFKRKISYGTIKAYKRQVLKQQATSEVWLDKFARSELANFYRQRIDELIYIQKNLFQILDDEKAKGDKMNAYKYNQIARTIIDNSKVLSEYGLAPPIISKIKELLPIDITELNKRLGNHQEEMDAKLRHFDEDNIKEADIIEDEEEEDNPTKINQNELEKIREQQQQARKTPTAFFLNRDDQTDRDVSGDNKKSGGNTAAEEECVF